MDSKSILNPDVLAQIKDPKIIKALEDLCEILTFTYAHSGEAVKKIDKKLFDKAQERSIGDLEWQEYKQGIKAYYISLSTGQFVKKALPLMKKEMQILEMFIDADRKNYSDKGK